MFFESERSRYKPLFFLFFFFFFFFGSPLQTDKRVQLETYVSQARFTQPKQTLIMNQKLAEQMKTNGSEYRI